MDWLMPFQHLTCFKMTAAVLPPCCTDAWPVKQSVVLRATVKTHRELGEDERSGSNTDSDYSTEADGRTELLFVNTHTFEGKWFSLRLYVFKYYWWWKPWVWWTRRFAGWTVFVLCALKLILKGWKLVSSVFWQQLLLFMGNVGFSASGHTKLLDLKWPNCIAK